MTSLRRIESVDEFAGLASAWDELVAASDLPDVFMRHAWFDCFVEAYAAAPRLAIHTLWRDGQLVGAAPLMRDELVFRGLRARTLAFLWSPVAPRCGFLAAESDDLPALLDGVLGAPDFDVLVTDNLPEDAGSTGVFLDTLRARGVTHQDAPGLRSPYRAIEGGWDAYWESLDRERRRYLQKKCVNRLEREGGFAFERIEDAGAFERFVPEMYEISSKSWKAGVSSELRPGTPAADLLVEFARRGLAKGWVDVRTLRLHGELIAFEYMLSSNGRRSVVRSDYDLDFKYFTPGNALRLQIVRDLFEQGDCGEYDLGGDEAAYKREWCDRLRTHRTVTAAGRTWRGGAILFAKNVLLPGLRRLTGGGEGAEAAA